MPDPGFEARPVDTGSGLSPDMNGFQGNALVAMSPFRIHSDPILDSTPLAGCSYGTLLAYLNRRFGPPNDMGASRNDLCGGWVLSTPRPELRLLVKPSVDDPTLAFQPLVKLATEREARDDECLRAALRDAYLKALLDLLRPVPVRDLHVNAMGTVERGDRLLKGGRLTVAAAPASCHAGIPGLHDRWVEMARLVERLGDGDAARGVDELIRVGGIALRIQGRAAA